MCDAALNYTLFRDFNGTWGGHRLHGGIGNDSQKQWAFHDRHNGGSNVVWADGHVEHEFDAVHSLRTKDGKPSNYWFQREKE